MTVKTGSENCDGEVLELKISGRGWCRHRLLRQPQELEMRLIALALMFLTVSFPVYAQRPAAAKTSEHAALNARLQAINSRVTERNRVECRKLVADSGVIGGGKIEVTRTPTLNRRRSCVAMVHSNLNQAVYEVPIKITGANGATRPHQLLCAYWLTSGEIKVIVLSAASLAHAPSYSPCHTF